MTQTELLAPARDLACGRAAVDAGADAVYIGAPRFGARAKAGNALSDIRALVSHAHRYWARVYVTVNTLLYDHELIEAAHLIHQLYEIGVDAIIIQDVGLLECDLPPIPLIASTQMHNSTPEKVAFLEQVGFERVILARELTLDGIRAIRRQTAIELEFFVHGALCVSYSGQCYMSYAIGGRSGNRGECAQPCRRRYSLVDSSGQALAHDRHLLSLKDLCLAGDLGALIDAGIGSFKIEGRLKDRAYVTNVVSYYRQRLDEVLARRGLARSSSGQSHADFAPHLDKTYNRGYTTYFLHGRDRAIGALDSPKMIGEQLGQVTAVGPHSFHLDTDAKLHNGDGLSFFDRSGRLTGTVVTSVTGAEVFPDQMQSIREGLTVYRNHDHTFLVALDGARVERRIAVRFRLHSTDRGFALTAIDEDKNRATAQLEWGKVPAHKPEAMLDAIDRQLHRTGETIFACTDVQVEWEAVYFLPLSALNQLRRDVLDRLLAVRDTNGPVRRRPLVRNDAPYPARHLTYLGNALNRHAEAFYRRHGVDKIEPAAESGLDMSGRQVMRTRYCLKHQLGLCPRQGTGKQPQEPLYLVDDDGHRYRLGFDCGLCEMTVHF
ncbi:MAG TPA: U32 family peptidase [Anaerolineae bacterium]|nr:U32 family peptidase [Anaerolineae bacterium]